MSQPFRRRLAERSRPALGWLARQPRWLLLVTVVALTAGGLLFHGPPAALALATVAAGLGWLALLAWPLLPPTGKLLRLVVIGLVVAAAVSRLTG